MEAVKPNDEKIKILLADDDNQLSRRLGDFIAEHGFEVRYAESGTQATAILLEWKPRFILADLMLPEINALSLMDFIKADSRLRHHRVGVIVMSGHNSAFNVKQAFQRGARDYIVKPFKPIDVLKRLVFHCRSYRKVREVSPRHNSGADEASFMLHLTDLILRQALAGTTTQEILFNLTRMASMKVDGVRCSVIQCIDSAEGVVVISNDNQAAAGIRLDLNKYPEVLNVFNTGQLIAIENISQSPDLKHIKAELQDVSFNSMVVCPVERHRQPFGVFSVRLPEEKETISDHEIRFIEIVAHVISLVLNNQDKVKNEEFWLNQPSSRPIRFPLQRAKK